MLGFDAIGIFALTRTPATTQKSIISKVVLNLLTAVVTIPIIYLGNLLPHPLLQSLGHQ